MEEVESYLSIFEEELAELSTALDELSTQLNGQADLVARVIKEGICKNDVLEFEALGVNLASSQLPIETFSDHPSATNLVLAGEGMVSGLGKLIAGVFKIVFGLISGIFKMLKRFIGWVFGVKSPATAAGIATASSAAKDASSKIPDNSETVNGGPSCFTMIPEADQMRFYKSVYKLRKASAMATCALIDFPLKATIYERVGALKKAPEALKLRSSLIDIAVKGLEEMERDIAGMKSVLDIITIQDTLVEVQADLTRAYGNDRNMPFDEEVVRHKKHLAESKKVTAAAFDSLPLTNSDFSGVTGVLAAFKDVHEACESLKDSSSLKSWDKAVGASDRYAKMADKLIKQIDSLNDFDTLSPKKAANYRTLANDIKSQITGVTNVISENMMAIAFLMSCGYTKLTNADLKDMTECFRAMIDFVNTDQFKQGKPFEVTVDIFGKPIKKKAESK